MLLIALFASLVSAWIHYPRFENSCNLTGQPEYRIYASRGLFEHAIHLGKFLRPPLATSYCGTVGSPCIEDEDCDKVPNLCPPDTSDALVQCFKGFCRIPGVVPEGCTCDWLLGCILYNRVRDYSCLNRVCRKEKCAECGQPPSGLLCCPPGVQGEDRNCFCGSSRLPGCQNADNPCINPNHDCCNDSICRRKCSWGEN